ncbi:MAG: shikimate dehydrogenase [Planctomycetales bacterium 4484_123]|nr:MAG: shikimate dehydrogenase [Planctomycetales bacterium 4484_123]
MSVSFSKTRLIAVLTQPRVDEMRSAMDAAAAAGADLAECRLDFLSEQLDRPALHRLLARRPLPVIVTCRPVRQGGRFAGPEDRRLELLATAAELGADYMDIEDDVPAGRRPKGKLILSHHDFTGRPADLENIWDRLAGSDAAVAKMAFAAAGPEDAVDACRLLHQAHRPAIALAMGPAGLPSRILARKFGAFGTYASVQAGGESAPGQLTIAQMKQLYRWDAIGPATAVYGVIGCPVAHSMSPAIHNAAFDAAGIDALYLPLRVEPGGENFDRFITALRAAPWMDLRGLSVTIPHKQNALSAVGPENVDELARRIGAINTILIEPDGALRGWNTDYAAAIDALCNALGIARDGLAGRAVAIVGAGGVARAVVAALSHYGAAVTIYNRTVARGERLAREFAAKASGLDALAELDAEIVINCTSVGMHPNTDQSPVPAQALRRVKLVFDTVYNPIETRLLREAAAAGCRTVTGVDMFVNQAAAQFEIWTGQQAPRELMRRVVLQHLGNRP